MSSSKLSSSNLVENIKSTTSATLAVETYVTMILEQEEMDVEEIPNLKKHQITAKKHAVFWHENVMPYMMKIVTDVISYSNEFITLKEDLEKYFKEKQIDKVVEGLKCLEQKLDAIEEGVQLCLTKLNTFSKYLAADYQAFLQDSDTASKKIEGTSGKLASSQNLH